MKRKIVEMMGVYIKEGIMSIKILDCPMLGFSDSDKVRDILNNLFSHVIISTVRKFDVSQILINKGNFYDLQVI